MRYILIILIAIPFVGVGQSHATYTHKIIDNTMYLDSGAFHKAFAKADTIPSSILISNKAPSFGHAIDGYCIYKYGQCSGKHLKYWHKKLIVIPPQYIVWHCKKKNNN